MPPCLLPSTNPSDKGREIASGFRDKQKYFLVCTFNTFQKWLSIVYMNEVLIVSLALKCQANCVLQKWIW